MKPNKLFALANYLQAFKFGALFLQSRIKGLVEEIEKEEGRGFLPEILFP